MLFVCMMIMCRFGLVVGRISLCDVFGFLVICMLVVVSSGRVFLKIWFFDRVRVSGVVMFGFWRGGVCLC